MPKYRIEITVTGYIELEADSHQAARERAEDGFSKDELQWEDVDIDDISEIKGGDNDGQ